MADRKDPTIGTKTKGDADAGWHPARPISEAADAADNKGYKDNPDKPDPSTIAQVEA